MVSLKKIYLKDIAEKYPKNLKNFYIANAPYINSSLIVNDRYLSSLLKNKGFKNLKICRKKSIVKRKPLYIKESFIKKLTGLNNITIVSAMPVVVPYAEYSFKVKSIKKSGQFVWIVLSLYENGKFFRNIGISAKSRISDILPVASMDIRRGEIIQPNELKFVKITKNTNKPVLKTNDAIIGCVATVDIRKGQFFTSLNTKKPFLVKRGDIVSVSVVENAIKISTVAKALRNGFDKDMIPIKYINSNRVVVAQVVGNKKVLVK